MYNDFSSTRLEFLVFLVHLFDVVRHRVSEDDTLAKPGTWRNWLDKGHNRQGMYCEVLEKTLEEVCRFFGARVTERSYATYKTIANDLKQTNFDDSSAEVS